VHEVVQDRHLEDAEQLCARVVAGEAQVVVLRRDTRDEPDHSDEHEDNADERCDRLDGRAISHGSSEGCVRRVQSLARQTRSAHRSVVRGRDCARGELAPTTAVAHAAGGVGATVIRAAVGAAAPADVLDLRRGLRAAAINPTTTVIVAGRRRRRVATALSSATRLADDDGRVHDGRGSDPALGADGMTRGGGATLCVGACRVCRTFAGGLELR
jgi:hypothetical protein